MIYSTLKTLGRLYEAKGKTVEEAVDNLKPQGARGISVLTLYTKGAKGIVKQRREKVLSPKQIKHLFSGLGSTNKMLANKDLRQIFGDFY